jgi:D-serine deaminase-like pyridoxal phosphate-dependent protein
MTHPECLHNAEAIPTPALIVFPSIVKANIARIVELAGGPERLRPHAKTHKTREITAMQLAAGVTKHKCATIAEAEMLADAGVPDVLLAYPAIGPTATRLVTLARHFPKTAFSALVDSETGIEHLARATAAAGLSLRFLVDVDVGQHRTGIVPERAAALYQRAVSAGLIPNGLHAYDGHNNAESRSDRDATARRSIEIVRGLQRELTAMGLPCPRIVAGGTPAFPSYAAMTDVPDLECSPGTYVLHDHGYGTRFPDLTGIRPAAFVLTRVVSKPVANRVTFDCGTKSIASDPPAGKRLIILDDPTLVPVGHNEEHYIVETDTPGRWSIGDVAFALPTHICPTVALHQYALTAENGRFTGRWPIAARDRVITI